MRLAIIDSGIKMDHPALKEMKIFEKHHFFMDNERIRKNDDVNDSAGHGTAVAGILAKICPNAEYLIIKVFDEESLEAKVETITAALYYLYVNCKVDLIHMSLGTLEDNEDLHRVCKKLKDKGVILVSAFDNDGSISFPAAYPEVIGVDVTPQCSKISEYVFVKNSVVNILVKSNPMRVAFHCPPYYCLRQGSSYSSPLLTAYIAGLLDEGVEKGNIMEELEKRSLKVLDNDFALIKQQEIKLPIKRAVLFPLNKETEALIKFRDLLTFEIVAVCDLKYSMKVGKDIPELGSCVKDFMTCSLENADTLILGHTLEIGRGLDNNILKDVIEKCQESNLNVYSFDGDFHAYCEQNNISIKNEYPYLSAKNIVKKNMGKLYTVPVPVVGIYGTGSKQGKYTLQLLLRKYLMNLGYTVGQIGTEPSALLFGMDGVIPFGYHSTIDLEDRDFITAVNEMIYESSKGKDIVLVGSQSGSVPFMYNNVRQLTIEQMNFIIAAMADVAILCVNIDDDIDYIKRTVDAIYGISQTRVICLAVYPLKYISKWGFASGVKEQASEKEIQECVKIMEETLKLGCYIIKKENMNLFGNEIITALSAKEENCD